MSLAVFAATAGTARADTGGSGLPAHYRVVNLGSLGGTIGGATALNDRGDVVGYSAAADGYTHPFLWRDGVMTDLGVLDPARTRGIAADVNNKDEVVGESTVLGGTVFHAFLWKDGHMTDLGTLSGSASTSSFAAAINDRGQVVGYSYAADGEQHAFLWQDGHMTDLGALGAGYSQATDINARGQVVGGMLVPTGYHAFLMTHRTFTDLGVLSQPYSSATGVNDQDWVVGQTESNYYQVGFLWHDGKMVELPNLGGVSSSAAAVNDSGVVVGMASYASGKITPALWYKGSVIDLATRGITGTDAYGIPSVTDINNRGQLVGGDYFASGPGPALYLPTDH